MGTGVGSVRRVLLWVGASMAVVLAIVVAMLLVWIQSLRLEIVGLEASATERVAAENAADAAATTTSAVERWREKYAAGFRSLKHQRATLAGHLINTRSGIRWVEPLRRIEYSGRAALDLWGMESSLLALRAPEHLSALRQAQREYEDAVGAFGKVCEKVSQTAAHEPALLESWESARAAEERAWSRWEREVRAEKLQ